MARRPPLVLAALLPLLLPFAAHTADPAPAPPAAGTPAAPVDVAEAGSWPRSLAVPGGTVVVYQPQLEKLTGAQLSGRAALSWETTGKSPAFGVFWFEARLDVDKDTQRADVEDLKVTRIRFPNISKEQEQKAIKVLEGELPRWDLSLTLDELQAALATSQREIQGETRLQVKPPKLLFSRDPAVLLLYDGKPAVRTLTGTALERVVNTQLFVVRDPATSRFYLSGGQFWYEASEPMGPWQYAGAPSPAVKEFIAKNPAPPPPAEGAAAPPPGAPAPAPGSPPGAAAPPATPPRIVVATEPTELIVFDGAPNYTPVGAAAELLYADNTDGKVLLLVPTNESYVLVSGRWFKAKTLEGPWSFVRPDQLPPAFAAIPQDGLAGDVRPFVPGTPEAADALADTQIPQTSAVKRDQKLEVTYDGEPKFKAIEGTGMAYATNTSFSVLLDAGKYWACDQAVWYVAPTPKGPWVVSDKRPPSIDQVPPSVPVYNTRYVYVYQSTPQVVYVGYLPGYVGVYPYYGTVVYGTGYYYPPYIGPVYYYPYPATFGVHMTYNPWTGWGVGVSYGTPFVSVGIHFGGYGHAYHHGGYYGPHGYRPPYRPPYGYRPPPPGYRPPAGGRPPGYAGAPGARPPAGGGARPAAGGGGIYGKPENSARNAPRGTPATPRQQPAAGGKPNNVYGDKSGNVYRQNQGGGWDKNTNQGWQSQGGAGAKPSQGGGGAGGGARPAQQGSGAGARPAQHGGGAPAGLGNDAAARGRSGGGGSRGGGRGGGGGRR